MNKQNAKIHTYRLEVSNFGPIVEANVEVRPLTVFVGPSNTGKSYLAILLYALHRSLQGSRERFGRRTIIGGTFFERRPILTRSPTAELDSAANQWVSDSKKKGEVLPIPDILANSVKETLKESIVGLKDDVLSELCRCFGTDGPKELVRKSSKTTQITLSIPSHICAEDVQIDLMIRRNRANISGNISNTLVTNSAKSLNSRTDLLDDFQFHLDSQFVRDRVTSEATWWLTRQIGSEIFDRTINRNIYYLPADRTGIMHAHYALVSALIQRAAGAGIYRSDAVPLLSGVLADFLDKLIRIGRGRSQFGVGVLEERRGLLALAKGMEEGILTGKVQLNQSESGYPLFDYQPNGWKNNIPLMRASSMVSELAPVVLYLRHLVLPEDILIIEEPESHLHPEMQAAFARQIALLVQAGIRVIVTTHSEWLLDQFANLVRLSDLPQSRRKGLAGGSEALHPDQFGAWLFKPRGRPKGSVVEQIKVDADAGGLLTDFAETADQLYNTWAEVGNLVRDSKAK